MDSGGRCRRDAAVRVRCCRVDRVQRVASVSEVSTWRLFAFMDGDTGRLDESRILAEWQLQDALRWCAARGFDHVYFSRTPDRTRFSRAPAPEGIDHSYATLEEEATANGHGGDS